MPSMISEMAVVGEHFNLLHFKWVFAYISRHTGMFNCLSVHIVSSGGIKDLQQEDWENYLAYSVRSCA